MSDTFNEAGFNEAGFDRSGFNETGFNKNGFNASGFNAEGFSSEGYNADGVNSAGEKRVLDFDWRADAAGGDEKSLKRLERYNSLGDATSALFEAQDTIRSGKASILPKDASEEQIADFRKANGIPEAADGYDIQLADGRVFSEGQQAYVDEVVAEMHGVNATPEMVNSMVNAYAAAEDKFQQAQEEQDGLDGQAAEQALRDVWGNADFKLNKAAIESVIKQIPEAARDNFLNARMADGTGVMNNPEMLMFLAQISREANPAATLVPPSADQLQGLRDRKAELKEMRMNDRKKFDSSPGLRDEYRNLVEAEQKMSA